MLDKGGAVNLFTRSRRFGKTLVLSIWKNTMYDGYLFGNTEVCNPWSVMNYVKRAAIVSYRIAGRRISEYPGLWYMLL
ncbi:hypothetical protein VSQ32_18155 [Lachnospiraceae bacterium KK002]